MTKLRLRAVVLVVGVCALVALALLAWPELRERMTCANTTYLPYPQQLDQRDMFALAYNVTTNKCSNAGPLPIPDIFDTVVRLEGKYRFFGNRRMYAYALHSSSKNVTVVAFGGTEELNEWIDDADYFQTQPQPGQLNNTVPGLLVHEGFFSVYAQFRAKLIEVIRSFPGAALSLSGYSLGGGLATVCALDLAHLSPSVTTFASPRVLNPIGARHLNRLLPAITRVFNSEDLVPTLPPPEILDPVDWNVYFLYEHVGLNQAFTTNLGSVLDNHATAYVDRLA